MASAFSAKTHNLEVITAFRGGSTFVEVFHTLISIPRIYLACYSSPVVRDASMWILMYHGLRLGARCALTSTRNAYEGEEKR
jgi:hypothetical protein